MAQGAQRTNVKVRRAIERRSFCALASAAPGRPPHVTGAMYALVDSVFYVATLESSIKARNISEGGRVALCVPIRRVPFAPPFCVHLQGRAELLASDDTELRRLLAGRRLKSITSHGELDDPDNRFVRIRPGRRVVSYGLGVSLRELLRDPLHATRSIDLF